MRLPDYRVPPALTRHTSHMQRGEEGSSSTHTGNRSFSSSSLTCIRPAVSWHEQCCDISIPKATRFLSALPRSSELRWCWFTDLTCSSHFLFPSSPIRATDTGCFQHSPVQGKHLSVTWEVTRYFPRCFRDLPNLPFSFLQQGILPLGSTKRNSPLKLPLSHTAQCNSTTGTQNLFPYSMRRRWHNQVIQMLGGNSSKRRRHCQVTPWVLPWRRQDLRSGGLVPLPTSLFLSQNHIESATTTPSARGSISKLSNLSRKKSGQ